MKIHYMLKSTHASYACICILVFAENFLVTPAQEKRKSLNQLRQETVEASCYACAAGK